MKKAYHLILILILLVCQKGNTCFCVSENETIETTNFSSYEELFLGKILNIKRIEAVETHEKGTYEFVGTITTFEVIKKWKGSDKKIIEIYQQVNTCGIDFSITNSLWVISAYKKRFITDSFKKEYPDKYFQTENCSFHIEELDSEDFENDLKKIDKIFPNEIELKEQSNYWKWIIILILAIGITITLLKRKK